MNQRIHILAGLTALKTDVLLKGQSASLTFKDPGVYSYNCALHPNMKGAVEVKK